MMKTVMHRKIAVCLGVAGIAFTSPVVAMAATPTFSWPSSHDGIEIPSVSGLEPQAQQQITAWLQNLRQTSVRERAQCRKQAGRHPFHYTLHAEPVAAPHDIVSFNVQENVTCGGAHGDSDTHGTSFDARTGAQIDVLKRFGQTKESFVKKAAQYYRGEDACQDYLKNPPMDDAYDLGGVFVTAKGLGANIVFNAGAAESCGETPAIVPFSALSK